MMEVIHNDPKNDAIDTLNQSSSQMNYSIDKSVKMNFDEAIIATIEALKIEGFGVLTEIDLKATFKKKLDVDFRNYRILGACNPDFAYQALQFEDKIGTMLPCNVIIQEHKNGTLEVSAVNPMASMQAVENAALAGIASKVNDKLKRVISSLK
ncbi:MAG: hypothetical protein ACI82Q_002984 [Nonlabens sp.]|jgi:uncharacterized protein (DUF302 family)